MFLALLGEHVDKLSEGKDCQIGRYSLLKFYLKKNLRCIGGAFRFVAYYLQSAESFFGR